MFWLFIIISAFLVYVYPIVTLFDWLGILSMGYTTIISMWTLTTLMVWVSFRWPRPLLRTIMVNWMGAGFILCCLCAVFQFAGVFTEIDYRASAFWVLGIGTALIVISILNALRISHKHLHFETLKIDRPCRIAQISDVHVGSRGERFLMRIVQRINDLNPEYLVITGDLLDTSKVDLRALSPLKNVRSPMIFVIGNHERYSGVDHVLSLVKELGITVLRNESMLLDDIQLIGIDDSENPNQVGKILPSITMDKSKYRILLYHRPLGWEVAQDDGIELMLSGHTHNGQIFPFNLLVKKQFQKIKGLYQKNGSALYVSPGTGTWGPIMRLGSANEITCINLSPYE